MRPGSVDPPAEHNASATTELAASIAETLRTIDQLAHLASDLRQRINRFRLEATS
jgi:methyl-accepting chemotaxis protein